MQYLISFLFLYIALATAFRSFSPSSVAFSPRLQLFAQEGRVTMYKKESCPFCKKARDLLEGKYQLRIDYVDVEEPDE